MTKTIPQVLKESRIERGWTQYELAALIGVTQSMISEWENETVSPRYDSLLMWAHYLGVRLVPIPLEYL